MDNQTNNADWKSLKEMQDQYVKERTSLRGVISYAIPQILIVCALYWFTR
jgi:hypothetical protein